MSAKHVDMKRMRRGAASVLLLIFMLLLGCGGSQSSGEIKEPRQPRDGEAPSDTQEPTGSPAPDLHLGFLRNTAPADGSFQAVFWLSGADGSVVDFSSVPVVTASRGDVSSLSARADGKQEVRITPDAVGTGEYPITVSVIVAGEEKSVSRTAIVMGEVADGWGQPVAVEGLVNTDGTQDSLAISSDGEHLFLHYYPITISCLLVTPFDLSSSYCSQPLGPTSAPERPNMPGADRVDYDLGQVHHGCPSILFDPSPVPVPPIAMYGFRRQADGSFAEPYAFLLPGSDGCFSPWGPSVYSNEDGTYRIFLSFNDPRNSDTGTDFARIYEFEFSPGNTQILGTMSLDSSNSVQIEDFVLSPATIAGADVHRGNPHVYYEDGAPSLLFYDDEVSAAADQFLHVSQWNGTSWDAATPLDFAPFNTSGNGMSQPYFDGSVLIAREGLQLLQFPYNGGAFNDASSWGAPTVLLSPQPQQSETGSMIIVAEPTMATVNGIEELYFIYGLQQADGSVNLRAGLVRRE